MGGRSSSHCAIPCPRRAREGVEAFQWKYSIRWPWVFERGGITGRKLTISIALTPSFAPGIAVAS